MFSVMFGWNIAKHILCSFSCIRHCQAIQYEYDEAESNEFLSYVIVPIASTFSELFDAID